MSRLNEPEFNKKELRKYERALSVLSNQLRLKILYLMYQNKDRKFNFNEIADILHIKKNKLAYHIALLKNNIFLKNEMKPDKKGRNFSYYAITDKGIKAINLIEKMDKLFEKDEKELEKILE